MDAPDDLRAAWEKRWPGTPPEADQLKAIFPERWVRFHSLPGSKRYPEDEAEYRTALSRHHAVLDDLAGTASSLVVVTTAYGDHHRPRRAGDVARATGRARRWWTFETADSAPDWPLWCSAFVSRSTGPRDELEPLLRLVADDRTRGVVIAPTDLAWLYHPYDGGADVLLPTREGRDALRDRHRGWVSAHPLGL